jgi:hypothetical protein
LAIVPNARGGAIEHMAQTTATAVRLRQVSTGGAPMEIPKSRQSGCQAISTKHCGLARSVLSAQCRLPGQPRDWSSMLKRLFFLSFMMAAVGVPYLMTASSGWLDSLKSGFTSDANGTPPAPGVAPPATPGAHPAAFGAAPATPTRQPIEGYTVHDLADVLQFDGTPGWVMARWPRVTSGLAAVDLQGYRVPLVTGTGAGDLAGSLTYYFNKEQRIEHITFHGTTGDPRKLIALVTQRYHLEPQKTDDPSLTLYQVKWNGKPQSELLIRPMRVLRADQPNARYEIDLALMRQ